MKCKAAKCMRMFAEKKATLLTNQQDHCSSGTTIKKDFQCPISDWLPRQPIIAATASPHRVKYDHQYIDVMIVKNFHTVFFAFDDEQPSQHFDTFAKALLTVFQEMVGKTIQYIDFGEVIGIPPDEFEQTYLSILTGEDWNTIMYNGIRSQGGLSKGAFIYSVYFVLLMIFGNCILFHLLSH
ncbi:hypothetical protein ACTXT7_002440 [Hymenolepis weldensis]